MGNEPAGEQHRAARGAEMTQVETDEWVAKLREKFVWKMRGEDTFAKCPEWISMATGYLISRSVERQEAALKRQEDILNRMHEENRRAGRNSLVLFVASIMLSVAAVVISFIAIRSSSAWQREQIPLLRKMVEQSKGDTKAQKAQSVAGSRPTVGP